MKICFDTNVVIDILGSSSDLKDSFSAYDVLLTRGFEAYIPMFITSDIAYILQRFLHSKAKVAEAMNTLLELFTLFDGQPIDCTKASNSSMPDYEDALIAHAAQRCGIDFILTRNKRDFKDSPVPALTPHEFLEIYKPDGIVYELLEV